MVIGNRHTPLRFLLRGGFRSAPTFNEVGKEFLFIGQVICYRSRFATRFSIEHPILPMLPGCVGEERPKPQADTGEPSQQEKSFNPDSHFLLSLQRKKVRAVAE